MLFRSEMRSAIDFRSAEFLSGFVDESGKIAPRRMTRLPAALQRRVARAVRARLRTGAPPALAGAHAAFRPGGPAGQDCAHHGDSAIHREAAGV